MKEISDKNKNGIIIHTINNTIITFFWDFTFYGFVLQYFFFFFVNFVLFNKFTFYGLRDRAGEKAGQLWPF